MNFEKFFKISFKENTSERLLLYYFSTEGKKSETIHLSEAVIFLLLFFRSNCPEVFCKKVVFRNFLEDLRPGTLFRNCEISKNTFFPEKLRWLLLTFAVEFLEILFCYKPQIVRKKFKLAKNFFLLFCLMLVISSNA